MGGKHYKIVQVILKVIQILIKIHQNSICLNLLHLDQATPLNQASPLNKDHLAAVQT